jgi:hypothetical protein
MDFIAQFTSINLVKDILVPAIAAISGLALATRKFKRERLWQEKYAAYQRILASIEAIRHWGDEVSSEVHMLPTIGSFDGKEPTEFYADAKREVAKQVSIGTILLSKSFVEELSKFQTELFQQIYDANEEWHEDEQEAHHALGAHASRVRGIADNYLGRLIELSRKDLGA